MTNHTLRWIIALMSLSLLGLLFFQSHWIKTLLDENKKRFEKDVQESLLEVSMKLEREASFGWFNREHIRSSLAFFYSTQDSMTIEWSFDSLFSHSEHDIESERKQTRPDTKNKGVSKKGASYSFEIDNLKNSQFLRRNQRGKQIKNDSGLVEGFSRMTVDSNYLAYLNNEKEKSEWVIQALESMLNYEKFPQKINREHLDSLLRFSFKKRGITLPFNFEIYDMYSPLKMSNFNSSRERKSSNYEIPLFASDLTGFPQVLNLQFYRQSSFLLGKIWLVLAGSAILTIVILFCFGFAIFIILRQKKLSDMKSDFINNMTHELKTPIATIGLAVEALQDNDLQKEPSFQNRYLAMIQEENGRLAHQVERVLQMAQMEKNEIQYEKEDIPANEIVKEAIRKINIQVEKKAGTILEELEAKEDIVKVDPIHFLQVILNLLDNAVKYSPEQVIIRVKSYNQRGNYYLEVKDHGMGMSKEYLNHIFQQFYRVPTGNLHDVKGFGLGLAYVRLVIEAHGGSVMAESELNRGSTFTLSLPLSDL